MAEQMRYLKAPAYMGKTLTIYVGGGDQRILDGVYYYGGAYAKFVGMGMLIIAPSDDVAQAKVKAPGKPKSAPKTTKAQRERQAADKKAAEDGVVAAKEKKADEAAAKAAAEAEAAEAASKAAAAKAAAAEGSVTKSPQAPAPTGGAKKKKK